MKNFTPLVSIKKLVLAFSLQLLFISAYTQIQVVSGGLGQTDGNPNNAANGGAASGLGCGGGGANFWGGNGGAGMYGGGGGGAAGLNVINMTGGSGGQGVLVVAFYNGASYLNTIVYQNGSSLTVGGLATSVKVWAIGAGGGGAGSTDNDGTAGGGGAGGGVAYITKPVSSGDVITYALGTGGAGGINTNNGSTGGNTTATVAGTTITANGGAAGQYNNNINAAGGLFSGGDGGSNGGAGKGSTGDEGGGGGGGIGVVIGGSPSGGNGGNGADAGDVSGLFAALSTGSLLPVKWKSFTVTSQKPDALLQWETSYELNILNFTVQYSTDGINFSNITQVAAANNPNGKMYNYTHQNTLAVTGYYRLYETNFNGTTSFSSVVKNSFHSANEKGFILTSNIVANGTIKLELSKTAVINLVSFDGKVVYSKNMAAGLNYLDVNNLPKGYYILQSTNEAQRILIQ